MFKSSESFYSTTIKINKVDIFLMLKKYLGAFQITLNDGTSILCRPQSGSLFPRHNMCLKHSESLSHPQSTLYANIVSCSCKQERGKVYE